MILIAYSGSTKTAWTLVEKADNVIKTDGINPVFMNSGCVEVYTANYYPNGRTSVKYSENLFQSRFFHFKQRGHLGNDVLLPAV